MRVFFRFAQRVRFVRSALLPQLLFAALLLVGCRSGGSAGSLRAVSLGSQPVTLPGNYKVAYYAHQPQAETTFMLSDVPIDQVLAGTITQGQLLHIDLIWLPKPGSTPLDPSATNATIRHVVISNGQVGVYGGAGFALPDGEPGDQKLTITLRDASLQLLESTEGFVDLLGPAQLTGTFTATRDEKKTRQLHYATSQLVTNALGRTRYVLK